MSERYALRAASAPPTSAPCELVTVSSAPTAITRRRLHKHGRRPHALGPRALGPPYWGSRWIPPYLPTAVQATSSRRVQTRHPVSRKSTCHCQKIRYPPPPDTKMASSWTSTPSRAFEASSPASSLTTTLLRRVSGECAPSIASACNSRLTHHCSSAYTPGSTGTGNATVDGTHRLIGSPSLPSAYASIVVRATDGSWAASTPQALQTVQALPVGRGRRETAGAGVAARAEWCARVRVRARAERGGLRAGRVRAALVHSCAFLPGPAQMRSGRRGLTPILLWSSRRRPPGAARGVALQHRALTYTSP